MMQAFRHSFFLRYFAVFLALYILNCSVEHPGANRLGLAEEMGINYQESLVELLIEQFLGYEYAIAEYEEEESPDNSSFKKVLEVLLGAFGTSGLPSAKYLDKNVPKTYFYGQAALSAPCFEIHSPPPNI